MPKTTTTHGKHVVSYTAEEVTPQSKFPAIEGISGIAIVVVFFRHLTGSPHLAFGVDVALASLSFIVAWTLLRHITKPFDALNRTYEARIKRIYPGLLLLVLVTVGMVDVFGSQIDYGETLRAGASALVGLANQNAILTQQPIGGGPATTNALHHLWVISLMMQFLIFWPLLIVVIARLTKSSPNWILAAAVVLFIASAIQMPLHWDGSNEKTMLYGLTTRSLSMSAGALAATFRFVYERRHTLKWLTSPRKDTPPNLMNRTLWTIIGVLGIAIFVVISVLYDSHNSPFLYEGGFAIVSLAIGVLLLTLTTAKNALMTLFSFSLFVGLGRISFSIYLVHYPLLWLARQVLPGPGNTWLIAVVAGIPTILIATLIHLFLLVPGRRTKWTLSVVVPAAALTVGIFALAMAPYLAQITIL